MRVALSHSNARVCYSHLKAPLKTWMATFVATAAAAQSRTIGLCIPNNIICNRRRRGFFAFQASSQLSGRCWLMLLLGPSNRPVQPSACCVRCRSSMTELPTKIAQSAGQQHTRTVLGTQQYRGTRKKLKLPGGGRSST